MSVLLFILAYKLYTNKTKEWKKDEGKKKKGSISHTEIEYDDFILYCILLSARHCLIFPFGPCLLSPFLDLDLKKRLIWRNATSRKNIGDQHRHKSGEALTHYILE